MLTSGIIFKNYKIKKNTSLLTKKLSLILKSKNEILSSLSQNYKDHFNKTFLQKYKKKQSYRIIGMGGSTLGAQTIYSFLKHKVKKFFIFTDNLQANRIRSKKKYTNIIISKSGNTVETIINSNIYIKKKR